MPAQSTLLDGPAHSIHGNLHFITVPKLSNRKTRANFPPIRIALKWNNLPHEATLAPNSNCFNNTINALNQT